MQGLVLCSKTATLLFDLSVLSTFETAAKNLPEHAASLGLNHHHQEKRINQDSCINIRKLILL